jgi:elongation factor 2 kinase
MASERSPALPKAAAGCLLYQILEDEETAGNVEKLTVLEETLNFLNLAEREQASVKEHAKNMQSRGKSDGFRIGDIVEGNYFMEGTYYSARVIGVLDGGESVVIQYDDDGSSETLTTENVRSIELVSAEVLSHETSRLSDEEAFGVVNTDEIVLLDYELMSKIGDLKEKTGDRQAASELFQQAAELAMNAGKMQTANNWSMRAAELES